MKTIQIQNSIQEKGGTVYIVIIIIRKILLPNLTVYKNIIMTQHSVMATPLAASNARRAAWDAPQKSAVVTRRHKNTQTMSAAAKRYTMRRK